MFGLFKKKDKVEKVIADMDNALGMTARPETQHPNSRGVQIYTASQLLGITGRTKDGTSHTVYYEQPLFYLTIEERYGIAKLCSPVAGIIYSRMHRISGTKFSVISDTQIEDRIADELKAYKAIFDEYKTAKEPQYIIARARVSMIIREKLPDVLPDLSNFHQSLNRWHKRIKMVKADRCDEIYNWLMQPNQNDYWEDFVKKWVFDLMVHGTAATYKEVVDGGLENFYLLPGGCVIPVKSKYVGGINAFVQITQGERPQIYYADELSYSNYLPTTARAYGHIPLEALINKVAESMLFDKLMAEQADGTVNPNKMVIIGENNPFGAISEQFSVPLPVEEQVRIENKLNQPKKGGAIVFSGNYANVVDLSRENTMQIQMERQKDIREEVGLVFSASNIEMNLGGSDRTSGRETSETQQEISEGRGIAPIVALLRRTMERDIIPFKFGNGYTLDFEGGATESESLDILLKKVQTGLYSVNELRSKELQEDPYGAEYDKPMTPQAQGGEAPSEPKPENPLAGLM